MLLLLIYLQLYIATTRQIVSIAPPPSPSWLPYLELRIIRLWSSRTLITLQFKLRLRTQSTLRLNQHLTAPCSSFYDSPHLPVQPTTSSSARQHLAAPCTFRFRAYLHSQDGFNLRVHLLGFHWGAFSLLARPRQALRDKPQIRRWVHKFCFTCIFSIHCFYDLLGQGFSHGLCQSCCRTFVSTFEYRAALGPAHTALRGMIL